MGKSLNASLNTPNTLSNLRQGSFLYPGGKRVQLKIAFCPGAILQGIKEAE